MLHCLFENMRILKTMTIQKNFSRGGFLPHPWDKKPLLSKDAYNFFAVISILLTWTSQKPSNIYLAYQYFALLKHILNCSC